MMSNRYSRELLDLASKLDAVVDGMGEITKDALIVAESQGKDATVSCLTTFPKLLMMSPFLRKSRQLQNH